ncbi:hypothetical protein [Galactobacter caseinivorans]|uniref:Uncharacterized protein n=1 Tax=Galactobacter caseinivorans TaxID=2676123 RepID=A0A496PMA5_9MICC|nr:hypothetical protein [Galactobacter caseinivorans]RKW71680.1 hypothetical protein DWQ67_02275 [Galactobacter caseinivorans]
MLAADHGERDAILRREHLYSSHMTEWRKAAEAELERTKALLDILGKTHALLETLSESKGIQKPRQR